MLPASVLGMLLLFLLLNTKILKAKQIESVCNFLLTNMLMFFVPVSVGIMTTYSVIAQNWFSIVVIVVISTICVLVTVGYIAQKMEKKK